MRAVFVKKDDICVGPEPGIGTAASHFVQDLKQDVQSGWAAFVHDIGDAVATGDVSSKPLGGGSRAPEGTS